MNDTVRKRVFISSVQKELEIERLAIAGLITADPFLTQYLEPVLFDQEPISGRKASKPYLDCLDTCQIYLLLLNKEYGCLQGSFSATHHEYRYAQKKDLPTLVFVKGRDDKLREDQTKKFFSEIKADGYTYKRFIDRLDLRIEVRNVLIRVLEEEYGICPSDDLDKSGEETLAAASPFESVQTEVPPKSLDLNAALDWLKTAGDIENQMSTQGQVLSHLRMRGLLWRDREADAYFALAAGVLFLGKKPSATFPQCRIMADAFRGTEPDPNPSDQDTITGPAPRVIEQVLDFVKKNTRHPPRIVGLKRIVLDEYPDEAVREAIVNAIAHRDYGDSSRQIIVEVFADRVVVSSPGLPPKPLTLAKLRRGKYRPCSRNPVLAQSLAVLNLMEQRGSGMARMKAAMLNHGLDTPRISIEDGYFQITLYGPGDDLDRLRIPADVAGLIPPAVEEQLNDRQKVIMAEITQNGFVTTGWCKKQFGVVYDTAYRDLNALIQLGLVNQTGKGRGTKYVLKNSEDL